MCYYDQIRFGCGDYKWGSFANQCGKEYRRGETCGMKLVYSTLHESHLCKLCEKIQTKRSRIAKAENNIKRWRKEGNRKASIEKAEDEIDALWAEIDKLERDREYKKQCL